MDRYGIQYMGSKNSIAKKLIAVMPSAENFYDLFGGGFAMTHCAIKKYGLRYKNFYFNEPRPCAVDFIKKVIAGEYDVQTYVAPFVSKDEFDRLKKDHFDVACLWSFGFDLRSYLYKREDESLRRSLYDAIVFNEFDTNSQKLTGLDNFDRLNSVEARLRVVHDLTGIRDQVIGRLISLKSLQSLAEGFDMSRLHFSQKSYDEVEIKPNSIVYCDIPYMNTKEYGDVFDHEKFYDWAASREFPVFISEYDIKDKRFTCFKSIKKLALLNYALEEKRKYASEKLYGNYHAEMILLSSIFNNKCLMEAGLE